MQTPNTPAVFNFDSHTVRTVLIEDQPWFVATDVCEALGIQNVTQAVARLDDDERSMFNIGRQGEACVINESGLYSLVLGSRKPEAKRFKKWVTSEVLPAIRKTGRYEPDTADAFVTDQQRVCLNRLVHERFTREAYRDEAFRQLAIRFQVSSLRDVPAARFTDATDFILRLPAQPRPYRNAAIKAITVLPVAGKTQQAMELIKGSKFLLSIIETRSGKLVPDLQYIAEDGFVVSSMNSIDQILDKQGLVAVPKAALQGFAAALRAMPD